MRANVKLKKTVIAADISCVSAVIVREDSLRDTYI